MIIPAAMDIYEGAELLKNMEQRWKDDQRKELASAKADLQQDYKVADTFEAGYELGIATARAMLKGSAELMTHGADPEKVL